MDFFYALKIVFKKGCDLFQIKLKILTWGIPWVCFVFIQMCQILHVKHWKPGQLDYLIKLVQSVMD